MKEILVAITLIEFLSSYKDYSAFNCSKRKINQVFFGNIVYISE